MESFKNKNWFVVWLKIIYIKTLFCRKWFDVSDPDVQLRDFRFLCCLPSSSSSSSLHKRMIRGLFSSNDLSFLHIPATDGWKGHLISEHPDRVGVHSDLHRGAAWGGPSCRWTLSKSLHHCVRLSWFPLSDLCSCRGSRLKRWSWLTVGACWPCHS